MSTTPASSSVVSPQDAQMQENVASKPAPENNWMNPFSYIFFNFIGPILSKGYRQPLEMNDLFDVPTATRADIANTKFQKAWRNISKQREYLQEYPAQKATGFEKISQMLSFWKFRNQFQLWKALFHIYGLQYFLVGFINVPRVMCMFGPPFLLRFLIHHISTFNVKHDGWPRYIIQGLSFSAALFAVEVLQSIVTHQLFHWYVKIGIRVQSALATAVFKKTLRITSEARQKYQTGEIVNLMSVDAKRVGGVFFWLHFPILLLMIISLSVVFIYQICGPATFAGLLAMILLFPLSMVFARIQEANEDKGIKQKDERVKLMNELLQGIRVVKYFVWENKFSQLIGSVRGKEIGFVRNSLVVQGFQEFVGQLTSLIGSIVTFTIIALTRRGGLDTALVFSTLTLYNILSWPLYNLQSAWTSYIQAYVSAQRIYQFLSADEIEEKTSRALESERSVDHIRLGSEGEQISLNELERAEESETPTSFANELEKQNEIEQGICVSLKSASFSWSKNNAETPELKDINLTVKKGQLALIIGTVGAGKSSLLNSLFAMPDMYQQSGYKSVNGTLAYSDQNPWIINATVRDNILFGEVLDEERYQAVVQACALDKDFAILPAGDMTEIGENGVNLSGGQRHRVSLARAVYSNRDILLLDSVLNAVDSIVQKHIFEKCLKDYLRQKTVLITMHSLQFLPQADVIVLMKEGKILAQGNYQELKEAGFDFAKYVEEPAKQENETEDEEPQEATSSNSSEAKESKKDDKKSKLVVKEDRTTGSISFAVLKYYFLKYGWGYIILILLTAAAAKATQIGMNSWLSVWTSQRIHPNPGVYFYLAVYLGIGVVMCIMIIASNIFFSLGSLHSANALHSSMLQGILRAKMLFFNQNPAGRILNRFAKDLYTIDMEIAPNACFLLSCILSSLSILILICIVTPLFLLAIIPIGILYYFIQNYYRKSGRELRRLESISRSPVFSNFSQCITGCSSIRAYDLEDRFIKQNESLIDTNMKSHYAQMLLNRWLGIRLQIVSSLVVLGASLFGLFAPIDASFVALSVTYSMTITSSFIWFVRMFTEVESNLTSVERVMHYCDNIEQEAKAIVEENRPPADWPQFGEIAINNLKMKYRDDLDYVLKGLTCTIKPHERIGVVGRTGAGKSSLMSALFRLVEASEGSIVIDDIDIATIGLDDIRSRMTIIPQDPVIFSGSIRTNVDFFQEHSDKAIWDVLKQVSLDTFVEQLPMKLEEPVAENGSNLSVGQKQLLSMARSILKHSKIVILDELNVDHETDMIIQKTIRTEFADSTCLIIAHRLDSIVDAHKIMVIDEGKVVEFDKPATLLSNPDSYFCKLVNETGAKHAEYLRHLANQQ